MTTLRIECTKRLGSAGNSLVVFITKEASILGLKAGDKVCVTITPIYEHED